MRAGTWTECNPRIAHKKIDVRFFKKPSYKYPFCDLCLYEAQKRNGTLPITKGIPINHRPESKPEKDSL